MNFGDYVCAEFVGRVGYTGDPANFFFEHGMEKIKPDTAEELAWQYAQEGAALGAIYPDIVRKIFEQTHVAIPKEKWDLAHASGLDIPPEQDLMSYEEVEVAENDLFMVYCRKCCPKLYSTLMN